MRLLINLKEVRLLLMDVLLLLASFLILQFYAPAIYCLVAPSLAKQYGPVPVVGVGHSCGALLHMLITSLFPDTPRAANALISYNNRGVGEAVPLFDELVVPLFSDKDRNGSDLMKSLIKVAREQYSGED